jgi:hypothetical protein
MADQNDPGPSESWDRVGRFFEDMARVGEVVVSRNLKMWSTVSQNLRRRDRYGADEMARDAAVVIGTVLDNVDDIWTSVTRPPEREDVAVALPTVFLYYALKPRPKGGEPAFALTDPAWIRVPAIDLDGLADAAEIHLDGREDGCEALRARLKATKVPRRGYKIEDIDPPGTELQPGFYEGIVYVTNPALPLASLQIVVQEP